MPLTINYCPRFISLASNCVDFKGQVCELSSTVPTKWCVNKLEFNNLLTPSPLTFWSFVCVVASQFQVKYFSVLLAWNPAVREITQNNLKTVTVVWTRNAIYVYGKTMTSFAIHWWIFLSNNLYWKLLHSKFVCLIKDNLMDAIYRSYPQDLTSPIWLQSNNIIPSTNLSILFMFHQQKHAPWSVSHHKLWPPVEIDFWPC